MPKMSRHDDGAKSPGLETRYAGRLRAAGASASLAGASAEAGAERALVWLVPLQTERADALVESGAFGPEEPRRARDVPIGLFQSLAYAVALGGVAHFL